MKNHITITVFVSKFGTGYRLIVDGMESRGRIDFFQFNTFLEKHSKFLDDKFEHDDDTQYVFRIPIGGN